MKTIDTKLFELEIFQQLLKKIILISARQDVPINEPSFNEDISLTETEWIKCLGIASFLAFSEIPEYQETALRIAQTALKNDLKEQLISSTAVYVLNCLTNNVAIDLAIRKQLITEDIFKNFSFKERLERFKFVYNNEVSVFGKNCILNKFQKEAFDGITENKSISLSAPTSAGKSFVLLLSILNELKEINEHKNSFKSKEILVVVPTRALISQIKNELEKQLEESELTQNIQLDVFPGNDLAKDKEIRIFILTQERLHWQIKNFPQFNPRLVIVDEAQKVSDGNRGLLLESTLKHLLSVNPDLKILFASPFTSNPEIFLKKFHLNSNSSMVTQTFFPSVSQNLILVTQKPRDAKTWKLQFVSKCCSTDLGYLTLPFKPDSDIKTLAHIAQKFKEKGQTIVYTNGASDAEKISQILFDLSEESGESLLENNELEYAIDFIKKTVHPQYALARTLKRGIAFHYGNIPEKIREVVENLFSSGKINILVCTSTLLEGVNLPAKNLILLKPCRGQNKAISAADFWNLAGRAGRWGKEFSGNVVIISPDKWKEPIDFTHKTPQSIEFASDPSELKNPKLESFILSGGKLEDTNSLIETYSNFVSQYIYDEDISKKIKPEVVNALLVTLENLPFPRNIIKRNPGVSPYAMERLWNYFAESRDSIETKIPADPTSVDAYREFLKLIKRIYKFFNTESSAGRRAPYFAGLVVNWSSGRPLRIIIAKSIEYQKKQKEKKSNQDQGPLQIQKIIRELLRDIDNFVRYEFMRDLCCYSDILKEFLMAEGKEELANTIKDPSKYLELGVSSPTQLSLLALGFSRSSTSEIADYWTNDSLTKEECIEKLRRWDLSQVDLPIIIKEEIIAFLEKQSLKDIDT